MKKILNFFNKLWVNQNLSEDLLYINDYCHTRVWHGCSRCGATECVACTNLLEFNKIKSLLYYDDIVSTILTNAKDKQDINYINLFNKAFIPYFSIYLTTMLKNTKYDVIIFAPIRKERVKNGDWHTTYSLQKATKKICLKLKLDIIIEQFIINSAKKALQTREEREKKSLLMSTDLNYKKEEFLDKKRILFIDDVLTSGSSALECYYHKHDKYKEYIWDILTLFRSSK